MELTKFKAWQRSVDLTVEVHRFTKNFPKTEIYGLQAQMRRCAVSIASNIAEGEGRSTRNERRHFHSMAHGSLYELKTQLLIAERLKFVEAPDADRLREQTEEVGRLLGGSIRRDQKALTADRFDR